LLPNGPEKYEAGQLARLLLEHSGAVVDDDEDVTTAVAAEVALAEPAEFRAPTFTRSVEPTSPATNT
jgi:hypothetical protein